VRNLVTVVGSTDRRLEQFLTEMGMRTASVSGSQFDAAATHGAVTGSVVILDVRANRKLPPALGQLRRQQPGVGVIIVAAALDPELMLEAMRAGVNEFLADPVTQMDLQASVDRLTAERPSDGAGTVLAFLGAKGGVGTTTTAVNVAAALSQGSGTVLFIDLHLSHGDAAVFMGAEPRFSVVDALENAHRLDLAFFKGVVAKTKAGPDLLASSDRAFVPASAAQHVRQLVEFAARTYTHTILDVPRSDSAALDALDVATRIVVVANQELATVRNAARIAEALRHRYGKERVGIIVSRYDSSSEIGQDDVERVTGLRLCATIPSDYRLALQALNTGRPLMLENHSRLAAAYRDLAQNLAGQTKPDQPAEASTGLFGRLLGRRS